MSPDDSSPEQGATTVASRKNVSLSRWVNERFPPWEQLLSAHDVARLTRRSKWVLLTLMAFGRFPRKRRFHGRDIGWHRNDVLEWMAKDLCVANCHADSAVVRSRRRHATQVVLPLQCARLCAARRDRLPCSTREARR